MSDPDTRIRQALEVARLRLIERWEETRALWEEPGRASTPPLLETFRAKIRSIAGHAGTVGYMEVSRLAAAVESMLDQIGRERSRLNDEEASQIAALFVRIARRFELPPHLDLDRRTDVVTGATAPDDGQRVVLLDGGTGEVGGLARQLEAFGFETRTADSPASFEAILAAFPPAFAVLEAPEGLDADPVRTLVRRITAGSIRIPGFFVVTDRDDFGSRLASVRAGAAGYYTRPVSVTHLVETWRHHTMLDRGAPLRVIVVDDDEPLGELYRQVLESAGMETRVVTRPERALAVILEARPDILVLDVEMPGCSGLELARIVRQFRSLLQLPIVFLTTERGQEAQIESFWSGGDDFIAKPVDVTVMISAIRARAMRFRAIAEAIARDPLTGLLNHSHIREALEREIARIARSGGALTVALVDLDHFKAVNDTHGHAVGDTVLQSLSLLLTRRLRSVDYAGRTGGEEFMLVLPGADAMAAARRVDGIRDAFAAIEFRGAGGPFVTTFSAGLAEWTTGETGAGFFERADRCLYAAKREGRNRVISCDPVAGPMPARSGA